MCRYRPIGLSLWGIFVALMLAHVQRNANRFIFPSEIWIKTALGLNSEINADTERLVDVFKIGLGGKRHSQHHAQVTPAKRGKMPGKIVERTPAIHVASYLGTDNTIGTL